ncbi:MAG TPA: VTT domain-containing protein [Pyrinomonadaceae bacterium]|jgi:membrane protein YqaA with SNARE-associated domain|nr:VTT domain-containing protein [Pyrinomonadaceae bacterium]
MLRFFFRLGIFGLFLLSALDSSFLVLPFGNDLLLIALVSAGRSSLRWIVYVLASALGSLAGVFVVDVIMRKTGEKGLERFLSPRKIEKFKSKVENKAGISVFIATVLPPPFPFTPVIMTASALQCSRRTLFVAVFVGRLLRFTIEALLALYFGRKLISFLRSDVVTYTIYGLMVLGAVLSTLSVITWLRRK